MSNVLVMMEQSHGTIRKSSLSAIAFAQQVAQKSGGAVHLVVLGADVSSLSAQVTRYGAAKVWVVDNPALAHPLAQNYTSALAQVAKACDASLIAAASGSTTKDVLPRLAARLRAAMASDVMAVVDAQTFVRPMWAGNVIATVKLSSATKVVTVRTTEFDPPPLQSGTSVVEALAVQIDASACATKFISLKEVKSERPDVTVADRIVSGGRGVKGAEGFKVIEALADALDAGVGASRAVCDAGWVPNDLQIGQTGKVVAPALYVAVGISGAIQHLAGMKGSKTIVAINKDPEAPIFAVADYGLVADLFSAVPQIIKAMQC